MANIFLAIRVKANIFQTQLVNANVFWTQCVTAKRVQTGCVTAFAIWTARVIRTLSFKANIFQTQLSRRLYPDVAVTAPFIPSAATVTATASGCSRHGTIRPDTAVMAMCVRTMLASAPCVQTRGVNPFAFWTQHVSYGRKVLRQMGSRRVLRWRNTYR